MSNIPDEVVRERMEDFLIKAGEMGVASGTVYCHPSNVEQFQRCAPPGITVKPQPELPPTQLKIDPEGDS